MDILCTDSFFVSADSVVKANFDRPIDFNNEQCDRSFCVTIRYKYMTYKEDEDNNNYPIATAECDKTMVFHHPATHAHAAITDEEIITWINSMVVVLPSRIMEETIYRVRFEMQHMMDQMRRGFRTSLALKVHICIMILKDEARSAPWIPVLIDRVARVDSREDTEMVDARSSTIPWEERDLDLPVAVEDLNGYSILTWDDFYTDIYSDLERWEQQATAESMEMSAGKTRQPASLQALKKLKEVQMTDVESSVNYICVVCIDKFQAGLTVTKMPCGHLFHTDCILSWLEEASSCPICRYELPQVASSY